ncbi:MAG TPA: hypothetical protein VL985_10105 [Stellaceae bacterium]|nr:hypothetical protein [Stellaceae bacterium]
MRARNSDRCAPVGRCCGLAIAAVLLLSGCAGPVAASKWVKVGVNDQTTAQEIDDCRARAAGVQNNQQGINADRSATLGRNWALSYTTGLQEQTMRQQTAAAVEQAFINCMRGKGFTPRG